MNGSSFCFAPDSLRVSSDTPLTANQPFSGGTQTALVRALTEAFEMRNGWQGTQARALAALLVAAGEALAQERRIVVSIPDRKLALLEDGRVVRIFPVAVGAAATPSPAGAYTVMERVAHPTWYGPRKVVPPGSRNPLGPCWIGLSSKGYGIHGTSNPRSIGKAASHGCIRLRNSDILVLFALVADGDPVELVAERTGEVARIFGGEAVSAPVNGE